jgi:hypothetical protein
MKKMLNWVEEERITLLVILLGIGVILKTLPNLVMLGGMLIYGSVIIAVLTLGHKLYLKLRD